MKKIILSSNSPRRKELLAGLDIPFEVKVLSGIDESYPEGLGVEEIPQYIAMEKAAAYDIAEDEIVITADTVVVLGDAILGKPVDENDAKNMLRALSGNTHRVVTGVCITSADKQRKFSVVSEVTFKVLSDTEIDYYVNRYRPFDKAGAYGIQEWIGYVGVTSLKGSYFNVMGLPVQRIYEELIHEFDVVVK
ncbi:MAG: septum formation protein Maf [Prevotella sp.]|nr:septum formation protein Maf [Prevotella sp.]MBQ1760754.1 septum formation protein Maf [Prevotella sp.]MBQ4174490.1 septum formation protein Maf [Prevotella sp.]MBQ5456228.1 septum formation protein Maf [Prevotella sp.]